jgi:hypothetical protein
MSLTTPAWKIVFEALKSEPDSGRLVCLAGEQLDENELFTICRDHGILLIVNNALQGIQRNIFSETALVKWREAVASFTLNSLTMHRELQRLVPLLADADIPVLPFKGPVLSESLYGDPALRMFADLDMLVPRGHVPAAVELLARQGYRLVVDETVLKRWLKPGSYHFHCALQHPSDRWLIEVHWATTSAWRRNPLPDSAINEWKCLEKGQSIETLLYLCIHGAQHWWWQLKWVVDVDRCVRYTQNLDWNDLFARAEERGCLRVVRLALRLAERVCGLDLPVKVAADIERDRKVAALARRVMQFWPQSKDVHPSLNWKIRYLLSCRERLSDRIGMILRYPLLRGVS